MDKTEPTYIFLGEATDVKETPPDPITYRACENRNCSFNQVVVIEFDNYQSRYCHVCSLPHSDAKKCVDKEVDNAKEL